MTGPEKKAVSLSLLWVYWFVLASLTVIQVFRLGDVFLAGVLLAVTAWVGGIVTLRLYEEVRWASRVRERARIDV